MPPPSVPLDAIRLPAFLYDAGGRIVETNDPAEALAGRPLAGCSAGDVARLFHHRHPDGTPVALAEMPLCRALAGAEPGDVRLAVTAADGRHLAILATAAPIRDGDAIAGALVVWQDVTELVAAGEALAESESRFRSVLEGARDIVYSLDARTGRYLYISPSVEAVLGYSPDELMAMDLEAAFATVHPDDLPGYRDALRRLAETGEARSVYRQRTKDGDYRWISHYASLARDDSGRPLRYVGTGLDITEQMRAAEALQASERRQAFLLALGDRLRELSSIGEIAAVAAEMVGRHLGANGVVYCEVDQHGEGVTVRADWTDGTVPSAAGRFRMDDFGIGDLYRRGEVRRTSDVTTALPEDARNEHCELRIRASLGVPVMRGGTLSAVLAVHSRRPRDWTDAEAELVREAGGRIWSAVERAKAEAALRENEEQYREIVETAEEGIAVHAIDGTITYVNQRMADLLGYPPGEIVGRSSLDFVDDEERRNVIAAREDVNVHGSLSAERRMLRKDGSVLWTLANVAPRRDSAGAVIGYLAMHTDITERRRADEALRESEEQFRRAIEDAPIPIIMHAEDGQVLQVSRTWTELTGYGPEEMPTFDAWLNRAYGEGADAVRDHVRSLFSGGCRTIGIEFPVRTRDGRSRYWSFSASSPGALRDGRRFVVGMAVDITERIEAEAALRRSEERQAFLLALSDALRPLADPVEVQETAARILADHLDLDRVAYFEVDGDDYVVERDFARSIPSVAGRHPVDAFGARLLADYRSGTTVIAVDVDADPALSDSEKASFGAVRVRAQIGVPLVKAGALVAGLAVQMASPRAWTPAEVALVEETAGRTWAAVERAKAEARLRASEGRFRSVLDHSLDALYRLNLRTGRYEYASPAFERVLGRPAEEMTSRNLEEAMTWIHPDDLGVVNESLARLDATGETEADYRVRDRDGRYRWVSNHLSLVRDESGRPLYRDGVVRDITGQKEAEQAFREYAESLRRSNDDLQRFAYVASHDLQEPLRSIISFSQLLERRYAGQLDRDADEYIEFIVEGGQRMQGLILDLLSFSRVNTTRQQITRTDAEDVLAEAVRSLDGSLREADAILTHDPMPVVMADPVQLLQVFSNLVSNAVKFRRPGVPLRIHVGARRLDGFWEFAVSDNGIGIEPEYFEKIFVIFQRLHTKETYPGTGIGLAIVKRIVDRHGGTVRVESTPGEGTTFFFTLPAA